MPRQSSFPPLLHDLRQLHRPLLISLVAHALVFWQAPGLLSPESPAAAQRHLRGKLQQAPVTPPKQRPATSVEPTDELRHPEERQYPSPRPEPSPPVEAPAEPANEASATPLEPLRTGIDVAGLRQYHLALGLKARQFRRYPQAVRDAGGQGRVTMRLAVAESGAPLAVNLLDGSGFPDLDRAALEMMLLAAGHTEVPESLRGRAFTIDLAVDFNPADAP